jgi:transposase
MAGKKGLKKRVWSDDEKRTICAQTLTPGVSVAQVARRYSMNANLIFKWLKDPRFAIEESSVPTADAVVESIFLPIEIEAPSLESADPARDARDPPCPIVSAQRVDITLSDGRRILVEGSTALSSVVGLIHGLTA